MSRENVDRFLQSAEAFNRRDLEAWQAGFDERCIFEPQVAAFEGAFRGHDGLAAFMRGIDDGFDVFQVHFDEIRDAGDAVLAIGTARGIGRGSGIEQPGPVAIVARFEAGGIVHFKDYGDREQAFEAAGLSE